MGIGITGSDVGSIIGIELTKAIADATYLKLSGENANQPIDLQGQDVSNVTDFTATNSVLAPNFYIGSGSPTGHLYQDVGTGNFDIAYYGNTPFVGWNVTSSTPYFGVDPTVYGYGVSYSSDILYVTSSGSTTALAVQIIGAQVIYGNSGSYVVPLIVDDACDFEDGSTSSFQVNLSAIGNLALDIRNNGDLTLSNSTYQFYSAGYGYIGSGIAWDASGRWRVGGGDPVYAQLESITSSYQQLILGADNSNYVGFNVAGSGGLGFRPSTNTTQGFNFQNGGGTSIVNIDTTNLRVGIGGITAPSYQLHTSGDALFGSSNATPIIRLGGNTSSHVALKRSSTTLQCILANDAGTFAPFSAGTIVANSSYLQAATGVAVIGSGGHYWAGAASYIGWTASNNASFGATPDVTLSRNAAGVMQIGTTGVNASGMLRAARVGVNGAPTHSVIHLNPTWGNITPQSYLTSNNATTAPTTGLFLHNDNQTAGAFTPFLIFAQRETDGSHTSSTAAIGSCSVTGSGSSSLYIDGELMFYTSPTTGTQGLTERLRIKENGDFLIAEGGDFIVGTTTGTKIGTATTQKLSLWNATPIVQPASANQAAVTTTVATTAATNIAPYGYTTQAQADDLVVEVGQLKVLVNQLRSDLVALGAIKGAA